MLRMRLKCVGRKRQPSYRIVVMPSMSCRDGKSIYDLGFYNPITKELKLDTKKILENLKNGVKPTKIVKYLLAKYQIICNK
jgi:small subunit ribosomal protein S16